MPQEGQTEGQATAIGNDRETRAILLYSSGLTLEEVAQQLGYANHSGAQKAVMRGLKKRAQETFEARDEMIAKQLEIIRVCVRGQMPAVAKGNQRAVEVLVKALDHEARLLGLYAPVKADVKITDALQAEINDLVEVMAALDAVEAQQAIAKARG
jgi:hypothetical protein